MKKRALLVFAAVLLVASLAWGLSPRSNSGGNPLSAAAVAEFSLEAEIVERAPAGSYVYLRVREPGGAEHWVASMTAFAPKGYGRVNVHVFARTHDFHSRRLDRRFDELWFAAVQPAVETKEQLP